MPPFPTNQNYEKSVEGLRRLHALALSGENESQEADAVRASLEKPWQSLSGIEQRRLTGLSEDLYSISEPPLEPKPVNPQAHRKLIELYEARQVGEWDKALELLRRWGLHLETKMRSYLFGAIWGEAGDFATAALFFEHAASLEPENENYACLLLNALAKSDRPAALARARHILTHGNVNQRRVCIRAASLQFASTERASLTDALPILKGLIDILNPIFDWLQSDEARLLSTHNSTYSETTGLLALCHDRLGDAQTATKYYDAAIAANPSNDAILIGRGILRYGVSPIAVQDFEHAKQLRSPLVWPYFFLAHHYLLSTRFNECSQMCEKALEISTSAEVRSLLFEWLAISRSELKFSFEHVRDAFENAVRMDPTNERIRRNFQAFKESAAQHQVSSYEWERPVAADIQAFGRAEYQPSLAA